MEQVLEKWTNKINSVVIGATPEEGGSRTSKVVVGGEKTLPFLFFEGDMPYKPVIAMEILDKEPLDWPESLKEPFKDVLNNPVLWAKKCVEVYKAELLCLSLKSIHPDYGEPDIDKVLNTLKSILKEVSVPLIILGCGDPERDNLILPKCSELTKGERCLFGDAVQENYKTLTASCLADGHNIIAESPIDINIAKQLNILISEMGLELNRIVINPTIGALGYGLEYAYSIMERARLAGLSGDKMLACPFICFVGQEAWRAKEAKALSTEFPEWGPQKERGILWEAVTALGVLLAGADILVMRHPKAIEIIRETIERLMSD
ncbi:MAG TPA: acetyl-CoA decarbonylase/synthase complex subunit delta [Candidatus Omnitrophica bacterium]|nr:MAG: acetyl-CoA decarbonylase/synthase complex subunit delta [Candidatus Omnitrophota bacterium]RKY35135.1 MAG: acetyl-CoA decarbonylase/synthase complex subunit delta [Candidatus Omnitrophota bacterium]RKY43790.1 MAG: acetyl-CoA decarbonylase/synthase complex subunit delta [Candidatus Omnitrophota bacterium]HEC69862.1 acetyl-CoA decarbonylase/synthase complex subunit delta [Candidatus Omnitrophota bacterium]